MSVAIRPYAIADKAACITVFESNIPDFFDATERDMLSTFLDDPQGYYYVIEKGGEVIGSGGFAKEEQGQARFTWGMVHRDYHGDGLGRLLAEHRLREIEQTGQFTEAELFTTPKVAPFFEKFGFATKQVIPNGFAPGMDQVQMIKAM